MRTRDERIEDEELASASTKGCAPKHQRSAGLNTPIRLDQVHAVYGGSLVDSSSRSRRV